MSEAPQPQQFPCRQCGADLQWNPGSQLLTCPYCGFANQIEIPPATIEELDFKTWLQKMERESPQIQVKQVRCEPCGAQVEFQNQATASTCPFCGSPLVGQTLSSSHLKPQAVLPFRITQDQAMSGFEKWLKGLWFAPSMLKHQKDRDRLKGIYTPYWTFDSQTFTQYEGQRGDDYWETETYTTHVNGKAEVRSRQVRKTRWRHVSGHVQVPFDDVLVMASESLPRKYTQALEPWDLGDLAPYDDRFLSGFLAEGYQVPLGQGFQLAQDRMAPIIDQHICRQIGGDHQRILWKSTQHSKVTFKHILLPVWLSAYRFKDRVFRFMVNARTGAVSGERPYSAIKIACAVLLGIGAIALFFYIRSRM
ncbi:MAG: hypothetical protein H6510_12975 [Acidobacteria bacterium]|nr:hypothetical protein [Acidobacteriota bacterium]MCB9398719.1 hypothetical protein [Acidobacteriota bacterium]